MRDPDKMDFESNIEKIRGDLGNAIDLKKVLKEKRIDAVFLLLTQDGAPSLIQKEHIFMKLILRMLQWKSFWILDMKGSPII